MNQIAIIQHTGPSPARECDCEAGFLAIEKRGKHLMRCTALIPESQTVFATPLYFNSVRDNVSFVVKPSGDDLPGGKVNRVDGVSASAGSGADTPTKQLQLLFQKHKKHRRSPTCEHLPCLPLTPIAK